MLKKKGLHLHEIKHCKKTWLWFNSFKRIIQLIWFSILPFCKCSVQKLLKFIIFFLQKVTVSIVYVRKILFFLPYTNFKLRMNDGFIDFKQH